MNSNIRQHLNEARAEVLAARKSENINDPIDTHVMDYVGMMFSQLFIKLHIIPNVVTVLSMCSGVSGGVLLAFESVRLNIVGLILVFLSAVFDCSDGQVARLTKHYSRLGRILDGMSDSMVYFSLYTACAIRMYPRCPIENVPLRIAILAALVILVFVLFVVQSQLPDYFKNLHMFMIDNSHGNELSRARNIKSEMRAAPKGSFIRLSLLGYYLYTYAQERRAPRTQKLLDAIEIYGKSDEISDAFYAVSKKLIMKTNLLTFNVRTIVLMICIFLHWELAGMLFVVVVLEPVRIFLLKRYERLSNSLLPMVK